MKLKDIYEELLETAKEIGISVRKENGPFKGGFCVINDEECIILNRTDTLETMSSVLARSLAVKSVDNVFIKPAIREYIEKETTSHLVENTFNLEIAE